MDSHLRVSDEEWAQGEPAGQFAGRRFLKRIFSGSSSNRDEAQIHKVGRSGHFSKCVLE